MRRAAKTDANQTQVVSALQAAGCLVLSLAAVGQGVPDLLVLRRGRLLLLEVKDGNKPPSARALTLDQERFHREWLAFNAPLYVVNSAEEALKTIGVTR